MNDNEIKKALECCSGGDSACENDCPIKERCESPILTMEWLIKQALDLINRQKAEIERLEVELKAMRGAANSYKLECERVQNYNENLRCMNTDLTDNLLYEVEQAKFEAYKEFAERLKSYFNDGRDVMYLQTFIHYGIDRLVKELTEVSDNA